MNDAEKKAAHEKFIETVNFTQNESPALDSPVSNDFLAVNCSCQ